VRKDVRAKAAAPAHNKTTDPSFGKGWGRVSRDNVLAVVSGTDRCGSELLLLTVRSER
jgi:hypothetical protein